jgi:hypothetical protein
VTAARPLGAAAGMAAINEAIVKKRGFQPDQDRRAGEGRLMPRSTQTRLYLHLRARRE